jgi:hypothetical protein
MIMNRNIVAATKIEPEKIAKARDGLVLLGYPKDQLESVSAILKITFLYGLSKMQPFMNIYTGPTVESMTIIDKSKQVRELKKF